MRKFGARGQRVLKIIHLIMVGLWVGGAVGLTLMSAFLGPGTSDGELYGYDLARKFVDDWVIIPGAMGCLFSGLLISWLTPWGFFKHRWVAVKWVLTVACILFGTFVLGPFVNGRAMMSLDFGLRALDKPAYVDSLDRTLLFGGLQVLVILFMVAISTLKPWKRRSADNNQESLLNYDQSR